MKPVIASTLLAALLVLRFAGDAQAARVRVVHTRHVTRVHVTVHAGFPIRRTFPEVVVREGVVVRVAPRVYLAPVTFAAVAIAVPARQAWRSSEALTLEDGWTDFTMNVNRRGSGLVLQVEPGAAQISFAEVVFENGETQVVDFNDAVHRTGAYNLLDFRDGRTVDHVRVVAKADTVATNVTVHLIG